MRLPTTIQRSRTTTRRESRRGAAVIEFAVVAPLLFLLILGMFEVGRYINVGEIATSASRFGAREATLSGTTIAQVQTAVQDYLTASGVKGSAATVTVQSETSPGSGVFTTAPALSTIQTGTGIRVQVTIDFAQVTWLPTGWFASVLPNNITGLTAMRKEST